MPRHTIHFAPSPAEIEPAPPSEKAVDTRRQFVAPDDNPVLLFGQLVRDARTVTQKLSELCLDSDGYHGNLQVMLSLTRHMESCLVRMIEQSECR